MRSKPKPVEAVRPRGSDKRPTTTEWEEARRAEHQCGSGDPLVPRWKRFARGRWLRHLWHSVQASALYPRLPIMRDLCSSGDSAQIPVATFTLVPPARRDGFEGAPFASCHLRRRGVWRTPLLVASLLSSVVVAGP